MKIAVSPSVDTVKLAESGLGTGSTVTNLRVLFEPAALDAVSSTT